MIIKESICIVERILNNSHPLPVSSNPNGFCVFYSQNFSKSLLDEKR